MGRSAAGHEAGTGEDLMQTQFTSHILALGPHGDECLTIAGLLGQLLYEPVKSDTWSLTAAFARLPKSDAIIALTMTQRLVAGRRVYGTLRLVEDRRDMMNELKEEVCDTISYALMAIEQCRTNGESDNAYRMILRHAISSFHIVNGVQSLSEAETLPRLPYLEECGT